MLNFDTSHAPVGEHELVGLIRAVVAAKDEDESIWVEWKSTLDLTKKAERPVAAKAILGMANRMPDVAARYCEGRGFVVLGAEPGRLAGLARLDPAKVTDALTPYVGSGPRWQPFWVEVDGVSVLVVEVGAPRVGDDVFPAMTSGQDIESGQIYVRRPGQTSPATGPEITQLVQRARGGQVLDGVVLELASGTGFLLDTDAAQLEAWLDVERERVRSNSIEGRKAAPSRAIAVTDGQGSQEPVASAGVTVERVRDLAEKQKAGQELTEDEARILADAGKTLSQLIQPARTLVAQALDSRSRDQYEAEVEEYITKTRDRLERILQAGLAQGLPSVQLQLRNETDENFTSVEVVAETEVGIWVLNPKEEPDAQDRFPSRPAAWGSGAVFQTSSRFWMQPNYSSIVSSMHPGFWLDEDNPELVRFEAIDLRPHQAIKLPALVLVSTQPRDNLQLTCRLTATNRPGVLEVRMEVPVEARQLTLHHVLDALRGVKNEDEGA